MQNNNSYLLNIIQYDWPSFLVHKISQSSLLWLNHDYICAEIGKNADLDYNTIARAFTDQYSYAIADAPCFAGVQFNLSESIVAFAEYYGGGGVGTNGGGARCGNWGEYQVKGIGPNPLIGESTDVLHTYGGLDAPAAILEVINSCVFNKIMPLGAVKTVGLILVSSDSGYDITKDTSAWGVLLVREKALRPAHLMRISNFLPKTKYTYKHNDVARVRRINKSILQEQKKSSSFIQFLGLYLRNQANQFAFARCARILNGVVTPSNNTLDGSWIDLNSCGMVDSGKNYFIGSGFFSEYEAPLNYAMELLHNFGKYNNEFLNPQPLIKYYNEQFFTYFEYHTCWVIGIPYEQYETIEKSCLSRLAQLLYRVIHLDKNSTSARANINIQDPLWLTLKAFFGAPFGEGFFNKLHSSYKIEFVFDEISSIANYFYSKLSEIKDEDKKHISVRNLWQAQALISLKRSVYSTLFYLKPMEAHVRKFCINASPSDVYLFIESYLCAANWIYDSNWNNVIIYADNDASVYFATELGCYCFKLKENEILSFETFQELCAYLKANNSLSFIAHLDPWIFFDYIKDIISVVQECK